MSKRKFFGCIGNPPYHEETEGTSDTPTYDTFMDAAYRISDKVMLITPGRFLFNAGKTPKQWNEKMLNDEHLKVIDYNSDSSKVFPGTDIKGGVTVTYHDATRHYEPIGVFSPFKELRSIYEKVRPFLADGTINELMYLQNKFNLEVLYADHPEVCGKISSAGNERRIVTSAFAKLPIFSDVKQSDDDIQIIGVIQNKRTYKWINSKYVEDNGNLNAYKVIVPKANGSGALGEVLSTPMIGTPMIGTPMIGYTQTFIGIGAFNIEAEVQACLKYVKTKFARTMLGILKITQDNSPMKWKYVPLQDFTSSSDIDWSQSVADIDKQLYAKYGLDEDEIDFIEEKVKAMP